MVVITCTIPTCDFKTDDVSEALAIALLANHGLAHQCTLPNTTASIAIGLAAAGNAHSIRPQPPRPPVKPSNQTRYPKLPHLILAMPAGDMAANMLRPGRASLVAVHQ